MIPDEVDGTEPSPEPHFLALARAGNWGSAFVLARATGNATALTTFADAAFRAHKADVGAEALLEAFWMESPPALGLCQKALIATYDQQKLSEATQIARVALGLYPSDPLLVAYATLVESLSTVSVNSSLALREVLRTHPGQFGNFYSGFSKAMKQLGMTAEAVDDFGFAIAKMEAFDPPPRTALLSAKVALSLLLEEERRVGELVPLLFELIDAELPHLQAGLEAKAIATLMSSGGTQIELTRFVDRIKNTGLCIVDIMRGEPPPADCGDLSNAMIAAYVASQFSFVNLDGEHEEDLPPTVSRAFLEIAHQGPEAVAYFIRSRLDKQPWHDDPKISDRLRVQTHNQ